MKKTFTAVMLLTLVFACMAYAGGKWDFLGGFPDTVAFNNRVQPKNTHVHGLAVDPDGNVWAQKYYATDSIMTSGGTYAACRNLLVYRPDGTQLPFSPVKILTVGGVPDTLWNSGLGLRADHEGNILVSTYNTLYRVNYKTGEGMNKWVRPDANGVTAAGVDAAGDIFLGTVLPALNMKLLYPDFGDQGNAIDTVVGYSRSHNVSADGNDIYYTAFSEKRTVKFHSDFGTFGPYLAVDTLFPGMSVESSCWNPKSGLLYLSSGGQTPADSPYALARWYGVDVTTKAIVDTIVWNFDLSPTSPANDVRPRAIAFSPGGDTAYVGSFGGTGTLLQMFRAPVTSVRPDPQGIPHGFMLDQNYPNPFNPKTEIKFSIEQSGLTTLVVYDLLGREIETLVSEDLARGAYTTSFNASKLSSGTYLYRLTSGGVSITKKMVVLK